MKLLFVGPLLDFSGFATASRRFLQALNESDLDLTARPLRYDKLDDGQEFTPPEWLASLLKNDLQGVDMALQMTTSNTEAVPVPGILNGLYTFFETDRLQPLWAQKANEFDFIIVPSRSNGETLLRSGVNKPILCAGPPCDIDDFQRERQPFVIEQAGDRTIFYNICQLSAKKGIDVLLRAYYAAFVGAPDEVLLVLKTYVNMENRQQDEEIVKQYIQNIKQRCRIPVPQHPPVLPLVYTMTDDEIHGLHVAGHAYVCSSRAEGWGLPVFDALAHGKTVITHNAGGLADFVTPENSLLYQGMPTFFFDMPHPDPGLFTGVEQCFEPSPAHLALNMRRFHLLRRGADAGELDETMQAEWASVLTRRENAKLVGQKFDYRAIGKRIVGQLESLFASWKETGTAIYTPTNDEKPSLEDSL